MRVFFGFFLVLLLGIQSGEPPRERCVIHVESFYYPPLARLARVYGDVKVSGWVTMQGQVTLPEASSGHPLLRDVALNNFSKWVFAPSESAGRIDVTYEFLIKKEGTGPLEYPAFTFDLPHHVRIEIPPPPPLTEASAH